MAALRIGYIIADPTLIKLIDLVRNGKNVNLMAQLAAISALDDLPYMKNHVTQVISIKDWVYKKLQKMRIEVFNTPANYLLIRVNNVEEVIKCLKERKILVRDRSSLPQLAGCFRVSIGTKTEMAKFLEALMKIVHDSQEKMKEK